MSDTAITALLEELREVDFDAWKDIRFLLGNVGMDNGPREIPLEQHIYQDLIQGCIQRAIQARDDLIVSLWTEEHKDNSWTALIRIMPGGYTDMNKVHIAEADTPAAAILAAYVAALEAMG